MRFMVLLSIAVCLALTSDSSADITVTKTSGSGSLGGSVSPVIGTTDQYDVVVVVSGMSGTGSTFVTINSDATDRIRLIRIEGWTGALSGTPTLFVDVEGNSGMAPGAITEIESISYNPPPSGTRTATISVDIELDPTLGTGRIGLPPAVFPRNQIRAMEFGTIRCRELTAEVVPPNGFSPGDIDFIAVDGDILAKIEGDDIGAIVATGDIGIPSDGVDPGLEVRIDADLNLDIIEARNIHADINVDGDMERVLVFGSGSLLTPATDAIFEGELQCDDVIADGIRIWGDLRANLDIQGKLAGTLGTRIAIGDDLETGASISIGSGGMQRGVTIGWMPGATGEWLGDITVDGETLAPVPDYTQTGLGGVASLGGAVGRVPYGAHFWESSPAYNQTTGAPGSLGLSATNPNQEITIAHYGIIGTLPGAPTKPYIVYEAPGSHCTSGCSFEFFSNKTAEWTTVGIGDGTTAIGLRDMRIKGIARFGQHYHVDVNGTLRCRDVFGEPTTAATKPYGFVFNTN